ncbi:hypothetical protein J4Q44_G00251920 [Coregonus suidteri]|uniref:ribonuclease P n=1 Tax=Coregonus suidteri TaxID=861788 RepID=A0AAN8LNC8_9TELE
MDTRTLSYELLLQYLTLCVGGGHHLYDIMRSRFMTLDTGASSLFIKGFSRTEGGTDHPREHQEGHHATAWALYAELMEKGLIPNQETWQALFQSIPWRLWLKISKLGLRDQKWSGSWSTVDPRGLCLSCQAELEFIPLSQEEYAQLKDGVMGDLIPGRDVLNETTPEELESFKNFVKWKPAFVVVIDGLNVANMCIKGNQSQMRISSYDTIVQTNGSSWHIHYDETGAEERTLLLFDLHKP